MVQVSSRLEFFRESYDNFNRDRSDLTELLSFLFLYLLRILEFSFDVLAL
jgi:hypothetical protein